MTTMSNKKNNNMKRFAQLTLIPLTYASILSQPKHYDLPNIQCGTNNLNYVKAIFRLTKSLHYILYNLHI